MLDNLIDGYCRLIGYLIAAMLAVMVLLVFGNVVMRYAFNSGFTVSEELSRWLFVWLTFLGAVVALRDNGHLGTDLLVGKLGPTGKRICLGLALGLMLYCLWLLFKGAYEQTGQPHLDQRGDGGVDGVVLCLGHGVRRAGRAHPAQRPVAAVHGPHRRQQPVAGAGIRRSSARRWRRQTLSPKTAMTITIFLGSLLAAMALGVPIAFSLLLCGAALMWHLNMFDAQILAQNVIEGANSFPLLAVPFFMLAGEIMNAGGLSGRIVNFAMALVGHVRGGLGYVTIVAAVIMASLSGSAVADAAALSALLLPMMVAAGHDKARSAGLIASAGIIAPIIPPSIGFVIFGVSANVSITKLFMAGIFPGIWLAAALWFTWWWLVRKETIVPPPRKSLTEVLEALRKASWALVLPFIIVFGLKFGVFTPTEAAVVAAVYALFVSTVVYRELNFRKLVPLFVSAARTCSVVMFLVAAAMVSAWLITVANLPAQVVSLLEPLLDSPRLLMLAIMVLTMVVGTALDMTPTILLLTPVLMPVVKAAGIDPVYFGVLFIINNAIGLITPPVGTVLNTVAGVGKMGMDEVTRGVIPFMIAQFSIMFLMVAFPQLVMVPARWFY